MLQSSKLLSVFKPDTLSGVLTLFNDHNLLYSQTSSGDRSQRTLWSCSHQLKYLGYLKLIGSGYNWCHWSPIRWDPCGALNLDVQDVYANGCTVNGTVHKVIHAKNENGLFCVHKKQVYNLVALLKQIFFMMIFCWFCSECRRPELSSSYDISGLEDTSIATCVTLQKPTPGEHVTFTRFNDSHPCTAAPGGIMQMEVTLGTGQQCGALIDLFYMYHEIHTPGSCHGKHFIKACDLMSSENDLSPCRLNCRCKEKCYGTVLASNFNNFEHINLCGILVL